MPKDWPNPSILRLGDKVLVGDESFYRVWRFAFHEDESIFISMLEPVGDLKSGLKWIIYPSAHFILLREIDRRPYTPKFIKRIVNFTRIYYRAEQPKNIRLFEFDDLVKGTHGHHRKSIKKAIAAHGPETLLTPSILIDDIIGSYDSYEATEY